MHAENELINATTVCKRELKSVEFSQVPHEDPIRLKASRSQLLNSVLQTQLLGRGHRESTNLSHFNESATARFQTYEMENENVDSNNNGGVQDPEPAASDK